jgi:hypothetical protein
MYTMTNPLVTGGKQEEHTISPLSPVNIPYRCYATLGFSNAGMKNWQSQPGEGISPLG